MQHQLKYAADAFADGSHPFPKYDTYQTALKLAALHLEIALQSDPEIRDTDTGLYDMLDRIANLID